MNLDTIKSNLATMPPVDSASATTSGAASSELPPPMDAAAVARVPGTVVEIGEPGDGDNDTISSGELRQMLDSLGDFVEDDVRDVLEELFEMLADYFGSEHWKLTGRQQKMLARPVTKMLNHLWSKLKVYLPEKFGAMVETTPGLFGMVSGMALVVGPKVVKQLAVRRERIAEEERKRLHPPEPSARDNPASTAPAEDGGQVSL